MGGRLRKLRKERGLSLRHVARRCGLSRSYLSEIELERRMPPRPSHPAYQALGEILGIQPLRLRRAAERERHTLIEGIPWHRSKATARH